MDLGLAGKRAAVAASSRGLGFACAAALAAEGARVVVGGRDADRATEAADRLGATAVVGDVAGIEGARAFVRGAREALGGIDILVTNAGGPPPGRFADISDPAAYTQAFELNALSAIVMCTEVVPEMQDRRWGRVVAITSIAVRQPIPTLILSNTARAGLTGFLKTLAREVAADGVTVNSLQPGFHDTGRVHVIPGGLEGVVRDIPAGRLGDPAELGATCAFVCSTQAAYLTGAAIPVDGGMHAGLQ